MIDCQTTQGERFKDARTVWNQYGNQSTKAVSDATGISTSIINALENETRSVGYEKVIALAKHYGVSVDWLSGFTNDPHPKRCAVDELGISVKAIYSIKNFSADSNKLKIFDAIIAHHRFPDLLNIASRYQQMMITPPLNRQEKALIADHLEGLFEKYPQLKEQIRFFNPHTETRSLLSGSKECFEEIITDIADHDGSNRFRLLLFRDNIAEYRDRTISDEHAHTVETKL